jgi:dynein heavy chain
MENAIRFGKPCLLENVGEELDPALEPVLLKQVGLPRRGTRWTAGLDKELSTLQPQCWPICLLQTYKQQGNIVLKLGDTVIPYHEDFRMYITTKLPNPHYSPEISTKLTLINFTLSPR